RAQQRTTYLFPFAWTDIVAILAELASAGPLKLAKCLRLALTAHDCGAGARLRLCAMIPAAAKLSHSLRKNGVGHLHVQSCANSANVAMFASVLSCIPYSLSLLGPTLEGYGPNQRNKWRHAAFGVVMSKLLYDVVQERLKGDLPPIVEIVPVGVDLEFMQRQTNYSPWQQGETCQIYSCGRLNTVKGHDNLIDAVTLLRDKGFDCHLTIAGEDEQGGKGYRRTLERHISDRSANSYVTLLGAISEIEHRAQLEQAHIFALASENEGISVAIMEAMAMQTPVVVTDVGGNAELVMSGSNGVLVSFGKPDEMAAAFEKILGDPEFARTLST
ncbi:glycosyltransferase, partial [Halomonas litopenaei]|nr:glycosyltransferase [Halomonas litopenaei]